MNKAIKNKESLVYRKRKTKAIKVKVIEQPKDVGEVYKKSHSFWGLVFNFFMLITTLFAGVVAYQVYKEAQIQTSEAKKATDIAKEALKQTIEDNNRIYELQKIQMNQAKEDAESQFVLQRKSLDAQIATLQQAQREFIKDNEPVLEMTNVDSININKDTGLITFKYNINNYGNRAVQFRSISSAMWVPKMKGDLFKGSGLEEVLKKSNIALAYITPSKPFKREFTATKSISPEILNEFVYSRCNFYFMERITYYNYINNKEMVYDFIIKLNYSKKLYWDYLLNKNYDPKMERFVMPHLPLSQQM